MNNHTPGPWAAMITNKGHHIRQEGYGDIFYIAPRNKGIGDIDANARLIAAAPDLLGALEGLLAHHAVRGYPSDTMDDQRARARAAIAKARG